MRVLSTSEYQSLSNTIFSTALNPQRWATVLSDISKHVSSARLQILAQGDKSPHIAFTHGYDPYWVDQYAHHYHAINLWARSFTTSPVGHVQYAQDMCADDDLMQTEFYVDWVLPQHDLRAGGGGVVARNGQSTCLFGANIPHAWRVRDETRWINLLRQIMPALQLSWSISRELAGGVLERSVLTKSESKDPSIFVLNEFGRITYCNPNGAVMMADGSDIRVRMNDRFHFGDKTANSRLQALLSCLKSGPHVGAKFDLSDGKKVRIARLDPSFEGWDLQLFLGLHAPSLLIVISPPQTERTPKSIASYFGLTQSEAAVALKLAMGQSPFDIAKEREVSIHTIRNQIKSAMSKTDCSQRAQLVAKILNFDL